MSKRSKKTDAITHHLRLLASEIPPGDDTPRGERLARLLFDRALGSTEVRKDDEGRETRTVIKPEAWAMQLVYERLEGKTPAAAEPETERLSAAARVRELAVARVNSLTEKLTGVPARPPKLGKKPNA